MVTAAKIIAEPIHAAPVMPSCINQKDAPITGAPSTNNATPRLAPELTPSTYGPANGLRKSVCICNPLTDNAPPARIATIALVRRMPNRICIVCSGQSPPVTAPIIWRIGMLTEPMPMSIIKNNRHAAVSAINVIVCRKLCIISAKLAIISKMRKPLDYQYCLTSIGY